MSFLVEFLCKNEEKDQWHVSIKKNSCTPSPKNFYI